MVLYNSTRSIDEKISAPEAVLRGIAPDGGLYIRNSVPNIPVEEVADPGRLPDRLQPRGDQRLRGARI